MGTGSKKRFVWHFQPKKDGNPVFKMAVMLVVVVFRYFVQFLEDLA